MKLEFIVNKYLLIWYMLYHTTDNEVIHKLKQKLWANYKLEYSNLYKEKDIILKDLNNYLPDNDLVYNIFENLGEYKNLKQETNRYRLSLMSMWDNNRRKYMNELSKILKYDFEENFKVCVVHPNLNLVETYFDNNIIVLGKKIDYRDENSFLTYLIYKILKSNFENIPTSERDIVTVVLELISLNELYTKMSKDSKYSIGKKELITLKNKIYPYWLMYLGVEKEDMEKYMVRDNIFFNINNYDYDYKLKIIDIFSFIKYLIKNKEKVLKNKSIGIEKVEIETL